MPLHTLQRDFQSAVLNGNAHFHAQVVGSAAADASQRLDIYARAYRLRLLEALQGDYAKLAILLGDAQFESLALGYIASHPSQHPSLRWLGRHMAGFLAATPPWSSQPLLAEMAAFEWTQSEVFDAPDDATVGVADIATLPAQSWAGLRLKAHPSLRRLDLVWNVPAIWRALDDGSEPPPARAGQSAQSWLMWRRDLDIHWRSLDAGESRAVDAWRNGACFAEICEGLCEWIDAGQVAGHAALLLKGWVGDGLVSALLGG
jgi:hypothetical protein